MSGKESTRKKWTSVMIPQTLYDTMKRYVDNTDEFISVAEYVRSLIIKDLKRRKVIKEYEE